MNFMHPMFEKAVSINEGDVVTIVIENATVLRNTVYQLKTGTGELVLSENFTPVEISKNIEFIDNILEPDFASKKITAKLSGEAERIAGDFPNETASLIEALNGYGELISLNIDYPVNFSFFENVEKVIKLLGFSVDTENMPLCDAVLAYMEICRNFFAKKLFVLLNFKGFVSEEEFKLFCKNVQYEKFRVLLIEAYDSTKHSQNEKKIIIDSDLCMIFNDMS